MDQTSEKSADKLGFIGGGAMGSALINGIIKAGLQQPEAIYFVELDQARNHQIKASFHIHSVPTIADLAEVCGTIILAVKPVSVAGVLKELDPVIQPHHLLISIAAGISLVTLESILTTARFARVMPNTPARIGCGVSAFCMGKHATKADCETVARIFQCVGVTLSVPESLMDAVTAISGSGPAYVYYFIESLIDAGVMLGLPRDKATLMAVNTIVGAAEMVKQTGEHPAKLRNDVTSPAGTTAAALFELDKAAFAATVGKAVCAAAERSRELGRLHG